MCTKEVERAILAGEYPIVRVATDEGLVGWGECFRRARMERIAPGLRAGAGEDA